jgi:hypothetical protein
MKTNRACSLCSQWAGDRLHPLVFAACEADPSGPCRQGTETCLCFDMKAVEP